MAILIALTLLSGCWTIDFATLRTGKFEGGLFVMWVGEGGSSGSGLFVYVPDPDDPLRFTRHEGLAPQIISPKIMYTDGGSIPRIAQIFKGFSPWGYAPAYMIHDWIFTARHCLMDGDRDPRYAFAQTITFHQSADILGEAIRTLVAERRVRNDDFAATTITGAVDSAIARKLWDEKGACAALQVSPEHVSAAEAAIPGSAKFAPRSASGPAGPKSIGPQPKARVISRISF